MSVSLMACIALLTPAWACAPGADFAAVSDAAAAPTVALEPETAGAMLAPSKLDYVVLASLADSANPLLAMSTSR